MDNKQLEAPTKYEVYDALTKLYDTEALIGKEVANAAAGRLLRAAHAHVELAIVDLLNYVEPLREEK